MRAWIKHFLIFAAVIGFAWGTAILWARMGWGAELDRLAIEYNRFHPSARFPEMPGFKAKEGLAVLFDIRLAGPLYWRNKVHAKTDPGQYRAIGWQFELGLDPFFWSGDLSRHLEFFYAHHSQHLLEARRDDMPFPVNDSLGLRWVIYSKGVK